jgi:uroporphyrinogen-III decarboxylase
MNIPFDIVKGKGPVIFDPLRTAAAVNEVREFVPEEWVPYVGQALNILREEVSIDFQNPTSEIGNRWPIGEHYIIKSS